jgi:hypothetical protein
MDTLMHNPFRKINKGAFQGEMHCPFCSRYVDPSTTPIGFESTKSRIKLLEMIGPFIRRYRCSLCGGIWRYDVNGQQLSPYSSFGRGLKLNNINFKGFVPLLKK